MSTSPATSPTFLIRRLTEADAPAYRALRLEALAANPESFLSTLAIEETHQLPYFEHELEFARHQPIYGYYGIFQNDELMGYTQIDTSYLVKQRHLAFLYNLYVKTGQRRQGLAYQLCQEIFALLRRETAVELVFTECNASNTSARAFYHRLGFRRCGIKPKAVKWQNHYDDAIELVLELETLN